jgi:hypothetical protein
LSIQSSYYGSAMAALSITTVVPVADLAAGVAEWTIVLGVEPTFVDGDRWAQFDVGATRLALAGTDTPDSAVSVMVKVDDIGAHTQTVRSQGIETTEPTSGAHEMRATVTHSSGVVTTLYSS